MKNAEKPPTGQMSSRARDINAVQWIFFCLLLFVFVAAIVNLDKLDIPEAPVTLIYISTAMMALTVLAYLPPVFRKLPRKAKRIALIALLPVITTVLVCCMQVQQAYEKTPQGAKEVAEHIAEQKREDAVAAQKAATKEELAAAQRSLDDLRKLNDKLEGCFSSFGHHLPNFEAAVKDSLENPHSFEHVKTVVIEPDSDGRNVVMEFRAQNGFGALRTAQIRARLYPEDCSIDDVGPVENE